MPPVRSSWKGVVSIKEVERILLAGAFGNFVDPSSCKEHRALPRGAFEQDQEVSGTLPVQAPRWP
jgi:uncharacterized 2Fe-2S/4Fe-4S cluster protein (DUF4445 family)